MDASIRGTGASVRHGPAHLDAETSERAIRDDTHGDDHDTLPLALSGLRVALVHDWLTGMRGAKNAWRSCAGSSRAPRFIHSFTGEARSVR